MRLLLTVLAFALTATFPHAQAPAPADGPFDRLVFRSVGPGLSSGRIDDFAVLESNPSIYYVATATSGVWKTVNNGTTFTPVFDDQPVSSIGAIAIGARDPNLVWVGTGENNNRQSSSWGDGVYKSTDGGVTWRNMGLGTSKQIARVIVDPVDYDVVYVAALGDLWGPGGDRGVFKTTDGGLTWTRVLFVDDETGATDLVMDPSNNKTLYASTYQRRRQQWGMNGGGPGSALWKSTDAGRTWTKLETGVPAGPKGRIQMDIWRANPRVLYARIEHPEEGGVYRTDDAGASWRKLSDLNPRPMYFSKIRIDPTTDSRIYVLGVQLHVSDDGGRTFRNDGGRNIHVDHHAMWINPHNPDHLLVGNDGGVSVSYDRAATWRWMPNLLFAQFYHVSYDMETPYNICGGLQDNYTWCGPSAVRTNTGIINQDWWIINGGDGFVGLVDPSNSRIAYAESQDGRPNRIDQLTNERRTIRPEPAAGEPPLRFNWDTAMFLSPHDPATIYVGANRLFRSRDRAHSWEAISPDLTTNTDRTTLSIMGVADNDIRIAKHDGVGIFGSIVTAAESERVAGLLYTGTDDGVVSVSRDAGQTWANVTANLPSVPKFTYVSKVAPSRFDDGTVYVTLDGHRGGDFATYVFTSTDFGRSWRSIASNLPQGQVARTITEDLKNRDVLYLGTETGLFVTLDRGTSWARLKANLPTVPIYEITLHPRDNDMILATHGRGAWILDDLTPIQQWTKAAGSPVFAFDPPPAVAFNQANDQNIQFQGDTVLTLPNPEFGAALGARLAADGKEAKWTIRDAAGAVVREIAGDDMKDRAKAGFNLVHWDLRVAPLRPMRSQQGGGGGGGFGGGGANGPFVLPGTYRATLTVDGREANVVTVQVTGDKDIEITDADRKTWHDAALAMHRLQQTANDLADAVTDAWSGLQTIQEQTRGRTVPANLQSQIDGLQKELTGLRTRLGLAGGGFGNTANLRGRIGQIKGGIMGMTAVPTETLTRQMQEAQSELPALVTDTNAATAKVAPLIQALVSGGVIPAPIAPVPPGH
ncbi:MAG: hypothetical protein Q8L86_19010 [Vicinamibacterales bacterium]|nr:hypothetical protein [Vicinamibacterales bacterium]